MPPSRGSRPPPKAQWFRGRGCVSHGITSLGAARRQLKQDVRTSCQWQYAHFVLLSDGDHFFIPKGLTLVTHPPPPMTVTAVTRPWS